MACGWSGLSFHLKFYRDMAALGSYLNRISKKPSGPGCYHCAVKAENSAEQILFWCPAWHDERMFLRTVLNLEDYADLSLSRIVEGALKS